MRVHLELSQVIPMKSDQHGCVNRTESPIEGGALMKPLTKNYRQLRNAESVRNYTGMNLLTGYQVLIGQL